jgi:murein DD-endopeptidase MepM/ murein hydrolase activator NlpD
MGLAGFLAGLFVFAGATWQFGNIVGSREAGREWPADPTPAIHRWGTAPASAAYRIEVHPAGDALTLPDVAPAPPLASREAPAALAPPSIGASPLSHLRERRLLVPVQGVTREGLQASFEDARGGDTRVHEAIDILAPRHTPVLAADDGTIARLFYSRAGGITVYQFDPSQEYVYYYAHLERYADDLNAGDEVRRGQVLGYVGTSGNAPKDTPHLHFAIYRVTQEKRWWGGVPIDPYQVLR